ncbi:MAG: hypothetical protein E6Q85_01755 [Thiothrix sp.]|nr:MAG: hypothetical protein E6Q85_01755 [Thiothrix sp.]
MSLKDAIKAKKTRTTPQKTQALEEVSKEEIKRLNVNLPASLLKAFKAKAAIEGKEMSEVIKSFIEEYVK